MNEIILLLHVWRRNLRRQSVILGKADNVFIRGDLPQGLLAERPIPEGQQTIIIPRIICRDDYVQFGAVGMAHSRYAIKRRDRRRLDLHVRENTAYAHDGIDI